MSCCQVFAKVVQPSWSKSRHRPWLCSPQGPAFIIRLCSLLGYHVRNPMFETEMLAPPQPSCYKNQVEICWSELPCASTRLGFQQAVSLKHIFQYWILATHFWGGQSLGKVTGSFQPTFFCCFLCFWNPVLTMHWSTKITFGLQPVHCSKILSRSVSLDFHEDAIHIEISPQSNASLNIKECSISLKMSVTVCHCENTGTDCQQWHKTDAQHACQCLCRLCAAQSPPPLLWALSAVVQQEVCCVPGQAVGFCHIPLSSVAEMV